jgi:hypothetical protein
MRKLYAMSEESSVVRSDDIPNMFARLAREKWWNANMMDTSTSHRFFKEHGVVCVDVAKAGQD